MQITNPRYNADGTIDLDIAHPTLGNIVFTASPTDPQEYGRQLFAAAQAGEYGVPAPPAPDAS